MDQAKAADFRTSQGSRASRGRGYDSAMVSVLCLEGDAGDGARSRQAISVLFGVLAGSDGESDSVSLLAAGKEAESE